MSILESFIKSQGGEVIREGESTSDELRSGQVDEPQLEESTEAEEVGNDEQVEDSTGVEETVEGVVGDACQHLTERIEEALGAVEQRTPTAEAFLRPQEQSQSIPAELY